MKRVVGSDKQNAKALSCLREILARILRVKGDELVHGGCLHLDLRYKFLELKESNYILEDDNWWSQEKDEFKHCMRTVSPVLLSLLGAQHRKRLAWESAEEDVLANHMVKESVRPEVCLKHEGAAWMWEVARILLDGL